VSNAQHKTGGLTPANCRLSQIPPQTPLPRLFYFLATRVATVRTYFKFIPHHTNGALEQSSLTHTLGTESRYILVGIRNRSKPTKPTRMHTAVNPFSSARFSSINYAVNDGVIVSREYLRKDVMPPSFLAVNNAKLN
jgi:hypothetical protein